MSDDDIQYFPVVYIPETVYVQLRDDTTDPFVPLQKQVGDAWLGENIIEPPGENKRSGINDVGRVRCVVLNNLHDCPVEGVSLYPNHSNAAGYPVVLDENGNQTRPTSSAKSLSGGTGTDWIDPAPIKNMASVGVWVADRPKFSFYGVDIGLTVQMVKRDSVLQLSLISVLSSKHKIAATLTHLADKRKSDDDFYDACDDSPLAEYGKNSSSPPNAFVLKNEHVKVSLRTGIGTWITDLYAFIEEPD